MGYKKVAQIPRRMLLLLGKEVKFMPPEPKRRKLPKRPQRRKAREGNIPRTFEELVAKARAEGVISMERPVRDVGAFYLLMRLPYERALDFEIGRVRKEVLALSQFKSFEEIIDLAKANIARAYKKTN